MGDPVGVDRQPVLVRVLVLVGPRREIDRDDIAVADVVVGVDAPDLLPTYSYHVPDHVRHVLAVGTCVHVPFGGRKASSYGPREQGRYAAEFYTTVKTGYMLA